MVMRWRYLQAPEIDPTQALFIDCEFVQNPLCYVGLELCLVQLYQLHWTHVHLCLPEALDWDAILAAPLVLYDTHADLRLIEYHAKRFPPQVWDAQLAFAFLQPLLRASYSKLVCHFLGFTPDKSHCVSDWQQHPLSRQQQRYAAADVYYLGQLYPLLLEALEARGLRQAWAIENQEHLNRMQNKRLHWYNINGAPHMVHQPRAQYCAQVLCDKREWVARQLNLAPRQMLHDVVILDYALNHHGKDYDLTRLWDMAPALIGFVQAEELEGEMPPHTHKASWDPEIDKNKMNKLNEALHQLSQEQNIAPQLLAIRRDLQDWLRGDPQCRMRQGWRAPFFADWK